MPALVVLACSAAMRSEVTSVKQNLIVCIIVLLSCWPCRVSAFSVGILTAAVAIVMEAFFVLAAAGSSSC